VVLFSLSAIARLLLSLWHALLPVRERREAPPSGVTLVRDRVCNTFLPRERALVARIDGHDEYFCSEACHAKALSRDRAATC
jgi:YHS domain-containing protein